MTDGSAAASIIAEHNWKGAPIQERRSRLICQWRDILRLLDRQIDGIDLTLPNEGATGKTLKETEDKIDALVCAWVGGLYLDGQASPLGDATSAIWVPRAALRFARAAATAGSAVPIAEYAVPEVFVPEVFIP